MSNTNSFPIGYGNYSKVEKTDEGLRIELYYGGFTIPTNLVPKLIENWGTKDLLKNIEVDCPVTIEFDFCGDEVILSAYDADECGIDWTLDDFKQFCC